jgi:excisionase family DNA binding protein
VQDTIVPPAAAFPHHGEAETIASGRMLTRDEVAEWLHVSRRTVRRLAKTGQLDETFVTPQSPRITPESVERHLERNRQAVSVA